MLRYAHSMAGGRRPDISSSPSEAVGLRRMCRSAMTNTPIAAANAYWRRKPNGKGYALCRWLKQDARTVSLHEELTHLLVGTSLPPASPFDDAAHLHGESDLRLVDGFAGANRAHDSPVQRLRTLFHCRHIRLCVGASYQHQVDKKRWDNEREEKVVSIHWPTDILNTTRRVVGAVLTALSAWLPRLRRLDALLFQYRHALRQIRHRASASVRASPNSSGVGRNSLVNGLRKRNSPSSQHKSSPKTSLCPQSRPSCPSCIYNRLYSPSISASPANGAS